MSLVRFRPEAPEFADLAHLVERHLAKVEVASSSLVTRSIFWRHSQVVRQRSAKPSPPVQIRVAPPAGKPRGLSLRRPSALPVEGRSFVPGILELIQDLQVRRSGRDFSALQGTKTPSSLYGLQVFVTPQGGKGPAKAACREILNRLLGRRI